MNDNPQKDNPVLCSLPFTQLRNGPQINYQPCCWAKTLSLCGPQNTSPIDHFKGEVFSNLRKDMLLGKVTPAIQNTCELCLENEKKLGTSTRLQLPHDWSALDNFDSDGKMLDTNDRFIKLEINAFGNHCNLECYECQPDNSSRRIERVKKMEPKWKGLLTRYSFVDRDVKKANPEQWKLLLNDIVEHGKNIKSLAFCGGEPMTMVSHFDILDALIETGESKEIEIMYVTNFTMFTLRRMKKYIDNFKWIHVNWSVDGLKERNHWLRYPTDWDSTLKNVLEIKNYLFFSNKPWKVGDLKTTITPSLLGMYKLKETVQYMKSINIFEDRWINKIDKPHFCRTQHLPDPIKEEIGEDIKSISQYVYDDMMQPRDEKQFQLGIKYFDALDKSRGSDWRSTFPEVACYSN